MVKDKESIIECTFREALDKIKSVSGQFLF